MDARLSYYPYAHEVDSDDDHDTSKMKRKHKDGAPAVTDDFSDLPLSSPPTKIRRLNVEFPPAPTIHFEHKGGDEVQLPQLKTSDAVVAGGEPCMDEMEATEAPVDVDVGVGACRKINLNEERALVLYRPVQPAASDFSFNVLTHFIPAFRVRDQLTVHNDTGKESLAVIPWAPNNFSVNTSRQCEVELLNDNSVGMDLEMEEQLHEEERAQETINANEGIDSSHHQWHHQNQKHCTAPQFPLHSGAPATPVAWSL